MAGVHSGSIIIDLKLTTPPGDNRTPARVYQQFAALTAAAEERRCARCSTALKRVCFFI